MDPKIIFEDETLLVLDKPAGWIVDESATSKNVPIIQTWLRENLNYETSKDVEFRSGIVHRLDKETSGVLLVAKTKQFFKKLQTQFKKREVKKEYLALVHGGLEPKKGVVEAPVGRLPWRRERFGVLPGGRAAKTSYKVEKFYKKGKEEFSLLNLFPETGRTHQIRIHLKHLGHAVVSDTFYAGRKTSRADRKWCPRLFLHAVSIEVMAPKEKKIKKFKADLPEDLRLALSRLERLHEKDIS